MEVAGEGVSPGLREAWVGLRLSAGSDDSEPGVGGVGNSSAPMLLSELSLLDFTCNNPARGLWARPTQAAACTLRRCIPLEFGSLAFRLA